MILDFEVRKTYMRDSVTTLPPCEPYVRGALGPRGRGLTAFFGVLLIETVLHVFKYVRVGCISMRVVDMRIEIAHEGCVTRPLANKFIEVVHRHTRALEKALRDYAIRGVFAIGTGAVRAHFVGEPRQPHIAAQQLAAATWRGSF